MSRARRLRLGLLLSLGIGCAALDPLGSGLFVLPPDAEPGTTLR